MLEIPAAPKRKIIRAIDGSSFDTEIAQLALEDARQQAIVDVFVELERLDQCLNPHKGCTTFCIALVCVVGIRFSSSRAFASHALGLTCSH